MESGDFGWKSSLFNYILIEIKVVKKKVKYIVKMLKFT